VKCPNCASENPEETKRCGNCSYDFQRKTATFGQGGEVVVTDIKMPFWSMVVFMVKWAIASIPALIILYLIGILLMATLGGMNMMIGTRMH